MSNVVVISGHPDLNASFTNTVILDDLQTAMPNVSVRRLDTLYPDYQIDVAAEQQALLAADVIVLQFPFYWYSVPALLKKWIDDVFCYNFAYGSQGDKLKGKHFILSFTIGGPKEAYQPLGFNHFPIEQLIQPLQQTAYLAGMEFHAPVYSHSMVYIPNVYNELEDVQARAHVHATRLIDHIKAITDAPESRIRQFVAQWFGTFDRLTEESSYFTPFLADDVIITMPEGEFHGHEGFRDWYAIARSMFKSDCQHNIEQLDIKPAETDATGNAAFEVKLRIRLQAETFPTSPMGGQPADFSVNETWRVTVKEAGDVTIHTYHVVPLATD